MKEDERNRNGKINGIKLWSGMLNRGGYVEDLCLPGEGNINMDLKEAGRRAVD